MKPTRSKTKCALALALAGLLASGMAMADKPSHAGKSDHGKGGQHQDKDKDKDHSSRSDGKRDHFQDRQRVAVNDYYGRQFRSGHCPPGLAKKHNGCVPPGHAKKWHVGQPLARDVVYYSVPQQLVVQIGQPPSGYRYVRVASDILMMAIGTRMIVDAIQDLGQS
jgi:Ni/Co efflux regulator RcnB